MRHAFARETLETEPEAPPRPQRARSLGRALFEIEDLPLDPEPPPRPRRRDAVRVLLGPEPLPEEAELPRPPSRFRWLAWIFRPESLDDPTRR